MGFASRLADSLRRALLDTLRNASPRSSRSATRAPTSGGVPTRRNRSHHPTGGRRSDGKPWSDPGTPPPFTGGYPGDVEGMPTLVYAPHDDDKPDPGEVVWTWVPYEEDTSVGKDRPVLIVGLDGAWLVAAQLTSKDHDRDAEQEASEGRYWLDIGTGDWDPRRRPSEVRLDRLVRVSPAHVRRTGGRLDRARFDAVAAGIRSHR